MFNLANLILNTWDIGDSNSLINVNPLGNVGIQSLAISHTCGNVLKSHNTFLPYYPCHVLALGTSPKLGL